MKIKSNPIFKGACTALITPFKNGSIDYISLKNLIEYQISNGIDALLINGTTGENATLTDSEARELISFAVREVGHRVPLIAGGGSNNTKKALQLCEFASSAGADAVLVVTPYYNKASRDGLIKHFRTVADGIDIPLILYNVPSRTGVNIPLEVYEKLADHENIVAVKEASASVGDFARLSQKCGDKLTLFSGNDDLILPTLSLGGDGVISVLSNILPKETKQMCKLYFEGNSAEATALQLRLLPLINALFSEVNPIPIKTLLAHREMCHEEFRLPLCPMPTEKKKALFKVYESFKF